MCKIPRSGELSRRLLLAVDASGYGSFGDVAQAEVQAALVSVLNDAAEDAGVKRSSWETQPSGDGELAILPSNEREPRVVDDYIRKLATAVRRRNFHVRPEYALRLRVAIHHGAAMVAKNGFSGQGVVAVSRLLECEAVRRAMLNSDCELALIVSDQIYQDTIAQGHTSYSPDEFLRVAVEKKEFKGIGWLWVSKTQGPAWRTRSNVRQDEPTAGSVELSGRVFWPDVDALSKGAGRGDVLIASRILRAAVEMLHSQRTSVEYRALVTMADRSKGVRTTIFGANIDVDPELALIVPLDFGVAGDAFLQKAMRASNITDANRNLGKDGAVIQGIWPQVRCVVAFPLLAGDQCIGTVNFDSDSDLAESGFAARTMQRALGRVAEAVSYLIVRSRS